MNKSGNIVYPGLIAAWSAKGKTNDDEDRAILKDLTGNGHDINLNGFAFSGMSGYGGYDTSFINKKDWTMNNDRGDNTNPDYNVNYTSTYFKIQKTDGGLIGSTNVLRYKPNKVGKFRFKINTDGTDLGIKQVIVSIEGKVGVNVLLSNINSNEVYEIDLPTYSVEEYKTHQVIFNTKEATFLECWMLPEYPDALVFDGVDDYGVNENMPVLTDYTIIAKRYRIGDKGCVIAKTGYPTSLDSNNWDFILEGGSDYASSTWSLSVNNKKNIISEDITFQTKNSYNGETISYLSSYKGKANCLTIGKLFPNDSRLLRGAFYSAYLFDRSLDEQEIKAFIRKHIDPEYLFPSEILTPNCYYDFSKGSNNDADRNTIKDYSGNGNDAVAHNFAWSSMSGYGGYDTSFINKKDWTMNNDRGDNTNPDYNVNYTSTYFKIQKTDGGLIGSTNVLRYKPNKVGKFRFKINTDGTDLGIKQVIVSIEGKVGVNVLLSNINSNEVYEIDLPTYSVEEYKTHQVIFNTKEATFLECWMLPEYPDALVFDGVDDYVSLDTFDSGFKTMFMVCNPRNKSNAFLYDQRKNTEQPYDYGLYTYNSVAYNIRNANGTYINGIKNTKVFTKDLNNKKILISVNSELTQLNKPTIGTGITGSYSDIALYKFLGFKEALTEEQIQTVIKKYNLLDGVDEIEVS
jgi:hypothetical protein